MSEAETLVEALSTNLQKNPFISAFVLGGGGVKA